jgi:uncharacterized protein YcfL
MKKSLFVAAIAALAVVSCKKTENVETTSADSAVVDSAAMTVDSAAAKVDSAAVKVDSAAAKVDAAAVKVDSAATKK